MGLFDMFADKDKTTTPNPCITLAQARKISDQFPKYNEQQVLKSGMPYKTAYDIVTTILNYESGGSKQERDGAGRVVDSYLVPSLTKEQVFGSTTHYADADLKQKMKMKKVMTDKEFWEKHDEDVFNDAMAVLKSDYPKNTFVMTYEMWKLGHQPVGKFYNDYNVSERTTIRNQMVKSKKYVIDNNEIKLIPDGARL